MDIAGKFKSFRGSHSENLASGFIKRKSKVLWIQGMSCSDYGSIIENRAYGPHDAGIITFKNFVPHDNWNRIVIQVF